MKSLRAWHGEHSAGIGTSRTAVHACSALLGVWPNLRMSPLVASGTTSEAREGGRPGATPGTSCDHRIIRVGAPGALSGRIGKATGGAFGIVELLARPGPLG